MLVMNDLGEINGIGNQIDYAARNSAAAHREWHQCLSERLPQDWARIPKERIGFDW
jgi:hypothetical protein